MAHQTERSAEQLRSENRELRAQHDRDRARMLAVIAEIETALLEEIFPKTAGHLFRKMDDLKNRLKLETFRPPAAKG